MYLKKNKVFLGLQPAQDSMFKFTLSLPLFPDQAGPLIPQLCQRRPSLGARYHERMCTCCSYYSDRQKTREHCYNSTRKVRQGRFTFLHLCLSAISQRNSMSAHAFRDGGKNALNVAKSESQGQLSVYQTLLHPYISGRKASSSLNQRSSA